MSIINYVVVRLLIAIPICILWSFFSFLISFGLHYIKGKDVPETSFDNYKIITDYIMIFLFMFFFYRENINLF